MNRAGEWSNMVETDKGELCSCDAELALRLQMMVSRITTNSGSHIMLNHDVIRWVLAYLESSHFIHCGMRMGT